MNSKTKVVAIMQPTFLPWIGYFDLIDRVDAFILLDDVQFQKQSWQQRNKIRTPKGLEWLTVPVITKGRFGQRIIDVEIRTDSFPDKHLKAIVQHYRKAAYFETFYASFAQLIKHAAATQSLCELNILLIKWFCQEIGIHTDLIRSSQVEPDGARSERLVHLMRHFRATEYLSPQGSREYLLDDALIFEKAGIRVTLAQFNHPTYEQVYSPFQPFACILDLFLNHGLASLVLFGPDALSHYHFNRCKTMKALSINMHKIGNGHPVYIIAEMSANHHHDYEQAVGIIEAARAAGANAIKLQTYTPETITLDCDSEAFQLTGTLYEGRTLYDLFKETYTPWEWHAELKRKAEKVGLDFFSTPFDHSAVDFLESLDVPAYKLASSELIDLPLIERIAKTGKPILMSTGMATVGEIEQAVLCAKTHGCDDIMLLKCTAAYPAPPENMNLKCIPALEKLFGLPIGLSDHSLGTEAAIAAVSLGARVIEKHITLSRTHEGADDAFSLEPDEFGQMVKSIRIAESMQGSVTFGPVGNEIVSKKYRRSIYVTITIKSGDLITYNNTRSIRPGGGISPGDWQYAIGKRARRDLKTGTPLTWDCIE